MEVGKHEHIKKKIDGMKTEAMAKSMSIPQVIKKVYEKKQRQIKKMNKRKYNVVVTS